MKYKPTLPTQIQKRLLRKLLEKVSITKKSTQYKTLYTLKTYVLEFPDNKNIGKLVSKCELFFLD